MLLCKHKYITYIRKIHILHFENYWVIYNFQNNFVSGLNIFYCTYMYDKWYTVCLNTSSDNLLNYLHS